MIDYQQDNVAGVLSNSVEKYDMVLDNIGHDFDLYWRSPSFTKPGTKYVQVGSQVSLPFIYDLAFRFLVPTSLGGGQRPFSFGFATTNFQDFTELGGLVADGKVKPVVDDVFSFSEVPQAYRKLKTGRARGKIVVRIASSGKQ